MPTTTTPSTTTPLAQLLSVIVKGNRNNVSVTAHAPTNADTFVIDELIVWLNGLREKLNIHRHEQQDTNWWVAVARELRDSHYTRSRARLAESWILKGYRYGTRLTMISDFFPTAEQVASVGLDVVAQQDVRRMVADAHQRGYQRGRREAEDRHLNDNREEIALATKYARQSLELTRQRDENDRLRREIDHLSEVLDSAREENERLLERLNNASTEAPT